MPIVMTRSNPFQKKRMHGFSDDIAQSASQVPDLTMDPYNQVMPADPSATLHPSSEESWVPVAYPTAQGATDSVVQSSYPDVVDSIIPPSGDAVTSGRRVAGLLAVPFLVYLGFKKELPSWARVFALLLGASTLMKASETGEIGRFFTPSRRLKGMGDCGCGCDGNGGCGGH